MADPKYAGLPGIVYDQPDVYETNELPESDQPQYLDSDPFDSNPAIEVLHISSTEAHKKFQGKSLDSSYVDFSDRISYKSRTGFRTRNIEYEIGGDDETVVQRYQRLQAEINNLAQDVQQIKGDVEHAGGKVSATELSKEVENLSSTMLKMNLETSLGEEILSSISDPQLNLQKKLETLLEKFKLTGLESQKSEKSSKADPQTEQKGITYELHYAPEHAKLNQLAKAAKLEKRLDMLETLVGNDSDKLSTLSTWTNHKSLLESVRVLTSKLALLEPSHLDHIEGRLHTVHTRMNNISEKKTAIEEADKQSKVNELYEMMKKSEALCSSLPEVTNRLLCVESLHQEAMQFSRSLKQLNSAQTQLTGSLDSNSQLLSDVQAKFSANLGTMQKNMTSLDERIQKLSTKSK